MSSVKKMKGIGILFIILALLLNPFFLGYVFTEDNTIDSQPVRITISIMEVLLLLCGIYIWLFTPEWIISKKKEILLLLTVVFLFLILFESLLHFYPFLFGRQFTNAVLSKYNTGQDGIYYYDEALQINFMKPNFTTINYYNGYYWLHQTDSKGFRNLEEMDKADIILLGDSFIYGHGVEFNQTVGYFIEKLTGLKVVNLGRQGDTSYHQMYMLNKFGLDYHPQYVLYFFSENDILDLYVHNININDFIKNNDSSFLEKEPQKWQPASSFLKLQKPYIIRAILTLLQQTKTTQIERDLLNDPLGWEYTEKAIKLMKDISDENNAIFIIIPLTPTNEEQFLHLKKLSEENNIHFVDTTSINSTNTTLFLENDGHFSEEGAKAVAQLVFEYIEKGNINK